ncbi:MAG: hypothetical protein K6D97_04455 [Clostridia bacterium]|nr:hypothetical protein [Clostridia bacterium]
MKVLFAVNSEKISDAIVKRYQKEYREILSYKNVFYFNAVLKELQKDKTYDRIVIHEDLEPFSGSNYEQIDKKIFEKLDNISDEAEDMTGGDTPIILICSDRHTKGSSFLVKIFGIGVYNALLGSDRSMDKICKLINRPRIKKEAKQYYQIDSEDVSYSRQSDREVDESQIINITNYFRKLGKNTSKYSESFEKIATEQGYTEEQLKIIINCLPANVKKVLARESLTYQKIMKITGPTDGADTQEMEKDTGIKMDLLDNVENKISGPIVIPSSVRTSKNKKIPSAKKIEAEKLGVAAQGGGMGKAKVKKVVKNTSDEDFDTRKGIEDEDEDEILVLPKKKKKKVSSGEDVVSKKSKLEEKKKKKKKRPVIDEDDEEDILPSIDELDDYDVLPDVEDDVDEETRIPGFEEDVDDFDDDDDDISLPGIDSLDEIDEDASLINFDDSDDDDDDGVSSIKPKVDYSMSNLGSLLTKDKKIVTFVGTTKNGTSFLVNNLAALFSSLGINTAILDMTRNRNSYYMYTNNEENLRDIAQKSIAKLQKGFAEGIKVNKNLTVYTSLPNDGKTYNDAEPILSTLVQNHSLVLIDCDFETDPAYFASCQEIYLVQSMDILTIQPLTAFLRDLKSKGVLEPEKIRVVINKEIAVRSLTTKAIIGGMSFYNDPGMSFMTELFNRDLVKAYSIPFEDKVYSIYLDAMVNCNLSINGYTNSFKEKLKNLGSSVYPLVGRSSGMDNGKALSVGGFGKRKRK